MPKIISTFEQRFYTIFTIARPRPLDIVFARRDVQLDPTNVFLTLRNFPQRDWSLDRRFKILFDHGKHLAYASLIATQYYDIWSVLHISERWTVLEEYA